MKTNKKTIGQHVEETKAIDFKAELEKQLKKNEADCMAAVNAALDKYNCNLRATVTFIDGVPKPIYNYAVVRR